MVDNLHNVKESSKYLFVLRAILSNLKIHVWINWWNFWPLEYFPPYSSPPRYFLYHTSRVKRLIFLDPFSRSG